MSENDDYTTGNLLDYENFSNHYKLIAIDLSKKKKIFIGKLERNGRSTMLFIIEKSEETTFNFSHNFVNIM